MTNSQKVIQRTHSKSYRQRIEMEVNRQSDPLEIQLFNSGKKWRLRSFMFCFPHADLGKEH